MASIPSVLIQPSRVPGTERGRQILGAKEYNLQTSVVSRTWESFLSAFLQSEPCYLESILGPMIFADPDVMQHKSCLQLQPKSEFKLRTSSPNNEACQRWATSSSQTSRSSKYWLRPCSRRTRQFSRLRGSLALASPAALLAVFWMSCSPGLNVEQTRSYLVLL